MHVESLSREALKELADVSPRVAEAFRKYQVRKDWQGALPYSVKKLANGYHWERELYEQGQKKSGSTLSGSEMRSNLRGDKARAEIPKLVQKGFENLSFNDIQTLQQLFPTIKPVVYLNKIARLRYMVPIVNGKICDLNNSPLLMSDKNHPQPEKGMPSLYYSGVYAMDKYGNLYIFDLLGGHKYIEQAKDGTYKEKSTNLFNHSSFLAGADVICAGNLHIGFDNRTQSESAGKLSAIDNASGHYQPSAENLRNCLEVFKGLSVDIEATRVGDLSSGQMVYYWGRDFLANRRDPWTAFNKPAPFGLRLGNHRGGFFPPFA